MADGKSWIEIMIMPLVIATVGVSGTYFVTRQQIESTRQLDEAQRISSENLARSEQQIKVLEIFREGITSDNEAERRLAVQLLRALQPDLAEKLAIAIVEAEPKGSALRAVAQSVAEEARERGFYFAVIGSFKELADATGYADRVSRSTPKVPYTSEIYLAENRFYAVTLGGYLTYAEAKRRVDFAKSSGLRKDAYLRYSRDWSANLYR